MAESTEDLPLLFLPTRQVSGASLNQPESRNRRKFSSRSFIEGRLLIELASNMRLVGSDKWHPPGLRAVSYRCSATDHLATLAVPLSSSV